MTIRSLGSALALSLAATAVTAAGPASAVSPRPSCGPVRAKTLALSPSARVYRVPVSNGEDLTGVVYGCLRPDGSSQRLLRERDDSETARVVAAARVSGRYAAYVISYTDLSCKADCPPDFEFERDVVRVADLRTHTSRALDAGIIDAKSLKVTSTTVSWTKNGTSKSAPLAAPVPHQ